MSFEFHLLQKEFIHNFKMSFFACLKKVLVLDIECKINDCEFVGFDCYLA